MLSWGGRMTIEQSSNQRASIFPCSNVQNLYTEGLANTSEDTLDNSIRIKC